MKIQPFRKGFRKFDFAFGTAFLQILTLCWVKNKKSFKDFTANKMKEDKIKILVFHKV